MDQNNGGLMVNLSKKVINKTEHDTWEALKYNIITTEGGDKYYLFNGRLHRDDGPAYIGENGDCEWYQHGKRHREDGPAYISAFGMKAWYKNGLLHREDGPAVIHNDGTEQWWINGKKQKKVDLY